MSAMVGRDGKEPPRHKAALPGKASRRQTDPVSTGLYAGYGYGSMMVIDLWPCER